MSLLQLSLMEPIRLQRLVFIRVDRKTVEDVAKFFGVNDPVYAFWFFDGRLAEVDYYFLEVSTTRMRLQRGYFDKIQTGVNNRLKGMLARATSDPELIDLIEPLS